MRILILSFTLVLCCASATAGPLEDTNKSLARRFYEQVWFSRNLAVVDEIFAPQYVAHDIGDRKGITEPAGEQKNIADFFWQNGTMTGRIDFQVAEGDLVATRWQWEFHPTTWWMKVLSFRARNPIPIINVMRFRDGKVVEIWNHRHDIDTGCANILFVQGFAAGLVCAVVVGFGLRVWRGEGASRSRRFTQ
jgi:predicted SnoaL-like aldol condensation-catalyzing enzyme